jgi:hypothetical protein
MSAPFAVGPNDRTGFKAVQPDRQGKGKVNFIWNKFKFDNIIEGNIS